MYKKFVFGPSKVFISVPTIPLFPFLFGKGIKIGRGTPPASPVRRVAPFCTSRMNRHHVLPIRVSVQSSSVLLVPYKDFAELWYKTGFERQVGGFPSIEVNLEVVCAQLNVAVSKTQIRTAAAIRQDFSQRWLTPRHDLETTLLSLRNLGLKYG